VKQVYDSNTIYGYARLDLDGNVVWFQPSEGIPSTKAAIAQGKLVFGDQKGFVYALDTAKGTVVWKINLQGSITTQKPRRGVGSREGTYACELPRIVNDTIVFYVNNKANLCGVDLSTGALKWHLRADADLPLGGCAQCLGSDEQSLYYVTRNFFRWVDAASGDITLTIDHQHHALKESMAWAGLVAGRYYFAAFNMSRKIVAFDTETGAIAWEFQEEDDHGGFSDAGIYTHGKFIIGRDSGHVYCFS
jgi:outer membrane protein assembly factor BamB